MKKVLPIALIPTLLLISEACQQSHTTAETERHANTLQPDPDNGGLTLKEGFGALVFADTLGQARHLVVRNNGDVYVALRNPKNGYGIVALRDTTGDGRADVVERFGEHGGTGIGIYNNYLYFSSDTDVYRYLLPDKGLVPENGPEVVIGGFPEQASHAAKPFTFDNNGNIYVNVGAPSNNCQAQDRTKGTPGQDPCPQLEWQASIWRFRAERINQDFKRDGQKYATGIRNAVALDWNGSSNNLYAVQHNRDQLNDLWDEKFNAEDNATRPAEEFLLIKQGYNNGWPYCFYDLKNNKRVLAPEYGGDGETVGPCGQYAPPIMAFPAHWAPNDLHFYTGKYLGENYENGAFVVFHGSWNRAPLGQAGYFVAFVPFSGEVPAGDWERFADGFAGEGPIEHPKDANHRPMGIAQGPDGSLYITDSTKGKIWRILKPQSI